MPHRIADDKPYALDTEPFSQQTMLRLNHVVIVIVRKFRALPITWREKLSQAGGFEFLSKVTAPQA